MKSPNGLEMSSQPNKLRPVYQPLTLPLSCIYSNEETWTKYMEALRLGWQKTALLRQCASPFCGENRAFYRDCAVIDAKARGYLSADGEYFYKAAHFEELRPYLSRTATEFPESPLSLIEMPDVSAKTRHSFARYHSGLYNAAILRVACIVDGISLSHALSKILEWHFDKYWGSSYTRQLWAADRFTFEDPPTGTLYVPPENQD
jgi:hypothetical protein